MESLLWRQLAWSTLEHFQDFVNRTLQDFEVEYEKEMLFVAGKFNFLNLVCHQISSIVKMFQDFVETLPNWSQSGKCS